MPTREIILNALTKRGKNVFRKGVFAYSGLLEHNNFDKKFLDQIINETIKHKQKDCNLIYEMYRKADKFEKRVLIHASKKILEDDPISFVIQMEKKFDYGGNCFEWLFQLSNTGNIIEEIFAVIYPNFILSNEYNHLLPRRYHNKENFKETLDCLIDQHGYIKNLKNIIIKKENKDNFIKNLN